MAEMADPELLPDLSGKNDRDHPVMAGGRTGCSLRQPAGEVA